jgi:hypothetical protein
MLRAAFDNTNTDFIQTDFDIRRLIVRVISMSVMEGTFIKAEKYLQECSKY